MITFLVYPASLSESLVNSAICLSSVHFDVITIESYRQITLSEPIILDSSMKVGTMDVSLSATLGSSSGPYGVRVNWK